MAFQGQGSLYHLTFVSPVRLYAIRMTLTGACQTSTFTPSIASTSTQGFLMAKRLTPIERAIAGEPTDRVGRYLKRLAHRGFRRATVTVPANRYDELVALCSKWRHEFEHGHD